MKKIILFTFLIISSLSLKSQINGAIISDSGNLTIIKVWGTHYERGFAYGSLLGNEISEVFNNYIKSQYGSYYSDARNMVIDEQNLKVDSIFKVEAQAIIAGMNTAGTNSSNMDYVDLLGCNSLLDISRLMSSQVGVACSSLISWGDATYGTDLGGKSVVSRQLDWQTDTNLVNNQILCINLPSEADEQAWISVGFAGMFSVLSGFNQNLGVFQNLMADFNGRSSFGKQYEPIWFSLRKSIEKLDYNSDGKNNVQDVRSVLMDHSIGYAGAYLISAIAKSTEIQDSLIAMIAEVAPTSPYLTFRYNNYADSIPGDNLYTANSQIARNNAMNFCFRYNAVIAAIGSGTNISSTESWELMRDHSHLEHNLQFMQYAPELDLFKISVYENGLPAYQNPYMTFSISDLFNVYVGIDEGGISEPTISFYPNPVIDIMTIKGLDQIEDVVFITVYDIMGKIVFSDAKSKLLAEYELNLESFSTGIYQVKVQWKETATSFKVVKM